MAVFYRRGSSPGPFSNYLQYRPFVREDFSECCAYCLLPEITAGGREAFELDHFRPKSLPQFAGLANDYYNLYYACHVCNHYKSNHWPAPAQEAAGYGFIDLCSEVFSAHFSEQSDGSWAPLSRHAQYTCDKLRLNRRHLVEIRRLLHEIANLRRMQLDWDVPLKDQISILLGSII